MYNQNNRKLVFKPGRIELVQNVYEIMPWQTYSVPIDSLHVKWQEIPLNKARDI